MDLVTPGRRAQVLQFVERRYPKVTPEQVERMLKGDLWLIILSEDGTKKTLHSRDAKVVEAVTLDEVRVATCAYTSDSCRVLNLIDFVTPPT